MGDDRSNVDAEAACEQPTVTLDETAAIRKPVAVTPSSSSAPVVSGTVVGRYVIVRALGRGGMGAVMLAYDLELARDVALKILHTKVASEQARLRMMREARAMARLSHPNIVAIYDVGTHDGNIYLAMEYIEGDTLQTWLKTPRSRREVLSVMRQAGRGLRAAHAAGIVHRDFKPANVLIAKDGRVCVLDFGIARTDGPHRSSESMPAASGPNWATTGESETTPSSAGMAVGASSVSEPVLEDKLTQDGHIVGTVGYFAPEAITMAGSNVDARSDVFGFCVTLWRALYGVSPFRSESLDDYLLAVHTASLKRPPGKRIPTWLHEVVRKGLHPDPSQRFSSMDELLRALDANPWRVRVAGAIVVLAAIAVAVGTLHHRRSLRIACEEEGAALATHWGDAQREMVRDAVAAPGGAAAQDRSDRVLRALDRHAQDWQREQQSSCEATRLTKAQTPAVHERRSACLASARGQFDVIVEVLGQPDPAFHERAMDLLGALTPPHLCRGREVDHAFVPLPSDPAARAKSEEARRLTLRARVFAEAGRWDDALSAVRRAKELSHEAGVVADEADALLTEAKVHNLMFHPVQAFSAAREAYMSAERSGADRIAGRAATELAFVCGAAYTRFDEARGWLDVARAKHARIAGDEGLELRILNVGSVLSARSNDPVRALEDNALYLERLATRFGNQSPPVCMARHNRALEFLVARDPNASIATALEAIACYAVATGPHDPWLGNTYAALSEGLTRVGKLDEARAATQRGLELRASQGDNDSVRGELYEHLSIVDELEGRFADAETSARHALAIAEDQGGFVAENIPTMLFVIGAARLARGDARDARVHCARGVHLLEEAHRLRPDLTYEGDVLRCLGEAEFALGNVVVARKHLEQSITLPLRWHDDDLARARFALARTLAVPPNPDRPRATQLATQARDDLRTALATRPWLQPVLDRVERWLTGAPIQR
ncbi:serine/threonine-protein kinase [Pendulispora rubella]|uniref:Serine/threonine-protein kinase n=1 Tax=Pendulispora rubella TaxID=2741070 RepID=A0ABZ2LA83_9BACT